MYLPTQFFWLLDEVFISKRNRYNEEKVARTINLHLLLLFNKSKKKKWKRVNLWCCTIKLTHFTKIYEQKIMAWMMQRVFDDDTGGENKIRFVLWHGLCLPMSFSFFVVILVLLHLTVTNHWIKILLCYVKEKILSVESKNTNHTSKKTYKHLFHPSLYWFILSPDPRSI